MNKKIILLALFLLAAPQLFATIWGPTALCFYGTSGTVAYLHGDSTIAGGGTWLSSAPGVISVTTVTAATAQVTATGLGTATITYNGPSGISTHIIHVDTMGADTGMITGPSTVYVGSSIQVSNLTAPIGSWAPGLTGNIDMSVGSYGSPVAGVTGISTGTALITYFVGGGVVPSMATKLISVIPAYDCISGDVSFPAGSTGMMAKVWLIKYDPATHMLYAVDSNLTKVYSDTIYYQFCGVGTDSFRVKVAIMASGASLGGALPTYYTSSSYWSGASVINHTAGIDDTHMDISMIPGIPTIGAGFISGDVTMGANKGTADPVPARNMLIYCRDQSSGDILQYTYTDDFGRFSFSNLPTGAVYNIYPEEIGYATTPFASISLSISSPHMTNARFTQHTLSHTITPNPVSVSGVDNNNAYVQVFPNPVSGTLHIHVGATAQGKKAYMLSDMMGRVIINSDIETSMASEVVHMDVSKVPAGLYVLTVKADGWHYTTKVELR